MKKLFVILAVLALASASFAATMALTVKSSDAKTKYDIGDTIHIEILAPGVGCQFYVDAIRDDAGNSATISGSVAGLAWSSSSSGHSSETPGTTLWDYAYGYLPVGSTFASGTLLMTYTYTIPNVVQDTITISAWIDEGNGYNPPKWQDSGLNYINGLDSVELNLVPEPMTIALLGLGGLFLRRKLS